MKTNNNFTPAEIAWLKDLGILGHHRQPTRKCTVRKLTPEERKQYGIDKGIGTEQTRQPLDLRVLGVYFLCSS